MSIKFFTAFIALTSLAMVSCNGNSENEKKEESEEVSDSLKVGTDSTDITSTESEVSYNLPSALQLAHVFKKSGSAFISTLPNDKAKAVNYNTTNYKRAINFGIYSSDLAYCLFNKKHQESKDYLKACKDLGAGMGLNQAFESDNMAKRFEDNIAKEDSLIKIISSVQRKTDVLFEQNKQKHITVIAFAGAWVESMYIASEVYSKEKNKKVLSSCLEQLTLTETIIKALKQYQSSEPEIVALISSLEKIDNEFKTISSIKPVLEKGDDLDLANTLVTDEEMKTIHESIKTLRKSIID